MVHELDDSHYSCLSRRDRDVNRRCKWGAPDGGAGAEDLSVDEECGAELYKAIRLLMGLCADVCHSPCMYIATAASAICGKQNRKLLLLELLNGVSEVLLGQLLNKQAEIDS